MREAISIITYSDMRNMISRIKLTVLFLAVVFAVSSCGGRTDISAPGQLYPGTALGDSLFVSISDSRTIAVFTQKKEIPESSVNMWEKEHAEIINNCFNVVNWKHAGLMYYVGIKDIEVTSDAVICGVAPGQNLSSHLSLNITGAWIGGLPSYPECKEAAKWTKESHRRSVDEFVQLHPILVRAYSFFCDADIPEGAQIQVRFLVEDETVGDRVIKGSTLIP